MVRSAEFLLGLLAPDAPPFVTAEDLDGPYAEAIRRWQTLGFIRREPSFDPVLTCPHGDDGTPYRLGDRWVCGRCRSTIEPRHLHVWPCNRERFLDHLAAHLGLHHGVAAVDSTLWRLGTGNVDGQAIECFFAPDSGLSSEAQRGLERFVRILVLHASSGVGTEALPGRWYPLLECFAGDGELATVDLASLLQVHGAVRFDAAAGVLRVGTTMAGEVPVGSKEFYLLSALAANLDAFVPYATLKREVLRCTGANDSTEEANFCQKLKSRIKKSIPAIDRLVVTSNKGDGYRLRGEAKI